MLTAGGEAVRGVEAYALVGACDEGDEFGGHVCG